MYKITLCAVHFKNLNEPCVAALDMDGGIYIFKEEMSDKIAGYFQLDVNASIEISLDENESPLMDALLKLSSTSFNSQDESKIEILNDISFPALEPSFKSEVEALGHKASWPMNYSEIKSELGALISSLN